MFRYSRTTISMGFSFVPLIVALFVGYALYKFIVSLIHFLDLAVGIGMGVVMGAIIARIIWRVWHRSPRGEGWVYVGNTSKVQLVKVEMEVDGKVRPGYVWLTEEPIKGLESPRKREPRFSYSMRDKVE